MDDMPAFERLLERRIHRFVGPVRPVDDLAVFDAVLTATQSSKWRFTMFSALKFAAAGIIVALFGGFLLTGILTTSQGEETVPAAVTESPLPDESDTPVFPTGTFLSEENHNLLIELNEDGTGRAREATWGDQPGPTFIYATHGDLYTEMFHDDDNQRKVPATYYWGFDGQHLTFELWGEDEVTWRRPLYEENTWRPTEDPRVVVVAATDIEAGEPIPYWKVELGFVPGVEVGPDEFTDPGAFIDSVPLTPIAKGQLITPDLMEPATQ